MFHIDKNLILTYEFLFELKLKMFDEDKIKQHFGHKKKSYKRFRKSFGDN